MKRQNILFVMVFGLILISLKLSAENPEGRFRIDAGDWFETRFDSPLDFNSSTPSFPSYLKDSSEKTELSVLLRYQLRQQLKNGNQIFNVSIQRIQANVPDINSNLLLGYDSYYPIYQDDKRQSEQFIQFEMEVTPEGYVSRFDSISGSLPVLNFDQIRSVKNSGITVGFKMTLPKRLIEIASAFITYLPLKSGVKNLKINSSDKEMKFETKQYSETPDLDVFQVSIDDSVSVEMRFLKKENIDMSVLVDASFPIPANTIIKGKLTGMENKEITIRLKEDYYEEYFEKKYFKTNSDGSFSYPMFLNRPYNLELNLGDERISFFLEPNDTLEIVEKPQKVERYSREATFYDKLPSPGYLINFSGLKGNASYNAKLSVEMDEWISFFVVPDNVQTFIKYNEEIIDNTNRLINQYRGKATESCINYYRSRIKYFLAMSKFYFANEAQRNYMMNTYTGKDSQEKATIDYPADFFLAADTLSAVMYPYEWCYYYRNFTKEAVDYKIKRLGKPVGGFNKSFYSDYYFERISLKGFPLYTMLYELLDEELRKGFNAANKIESFYQDFIHNCNDPALVNPLIKTHQTISKLAIGNTFPVKSYALKDNTVFDLNKYKGKPVCLVFLYSAKREINDFKSEIEKFESDEVEFLFVYIPNNYIDPTPVDSSILALPNVKLIEIQDDGIRDQILVAKMSKIFMLDKWLRIVEDDIPNPGNYIGFPDFENALKKAIEAKRFTKKQKASAIKTAGWSLGSILFTLMIVLWIYRVRIRNLKKKEAIKRQIKELEIKAIRSQMNPHFVFNALNSIQSLVNSSQYKETNVYLAKFSVLLRGVLNNSEKSKISLSDELEAVKLYCELEQLRFEFELQFEVEPDLDSDLIEIPGMIIQPLAENAVVHGLASLGKKGLLQIKINSCPEGLCVSVSDNGVGLPEREEDKLREKGYGLKLVEERLLILNQKDKKARLIVENNKGGQGTTARLIIPIDNV
ncbi:MAG: histidine kinase [Prolixibacteraceae bacterium]|nr:histidine kinase [Prolixibacteraceae bacterium]